MARIDWNKVAVDYKNSTFDRKRLYQYAKKAAEALKVRTIAFDGYTDSDWQDPPKPTPNKGLLASLHQLFIPEPDPSETRPPLARQHIGYWVLESDEQEHHGGYRRSEPYLTKSGYIKEKKDIVFTGQGFVRKTKWVLLEDGSLAVYVTKQSYSEYPPINISRSIKEIGSAALSCDIQKKEFSNEWRSMTDVDIFMLDHKKRKVRRYLVRRDNYDVDDGNYISMDNYLITGKKGGGCSKKITALLKKHNL